MSGPVTMAVPRCLSRPPATSLAESLVRSCGAPPEPSLGRNAATNAGSRASAMTRRKRTRMIQVNLAAVNAARYGRQERAAQCRALLVASPDPLFSRHDLELEGVAVPADAYGRSLHRALLQQFLGERILDVLQDRAPERTRSERGLVAELDQVFLGRIVELQAHVPRSEQRAHAIDLNVDDARQIRAGERAEHDDVVDAIQELRTKEAAELVDQHVPQRF